MQIGWVVFDGVFPQPVVFRTLCRLRLNRDLFSFDLDGRVRLRQQVVVPAGVLFLAPVGPDQEIKTVGLEIGDRRDITLAGFVPEAVQQQDGLRAEPAADAPRLTRMAKVFIAMKIFKDNLFIITWITSLERFSSVPSNFRSSPG